jgi:class 3 adenylate cyclase
VTALFADVVGSTALAERMDAEDWTAMINEAFDEMSKAIFRYEGTIAQLQGDAMVAFLAHRLLTRTTRTERCVLPWSWSRRSTSLPVSST